MRRGRGVEDGQLGEDGTQKAVRVMVLKLHSWADGAVFGVFQRPRKQRRWLISGFAFSLEVRGPINL